MFRSSRADWVKTLVWDGSGLVLIWKQLEDHPFCWPLMVDGAGIRRAVCSKEQPTFGDALAVRRSLWAEAARFQTSRRDCDRVEVPRAVLDRLTDLACHAA